MTRAGFSLTKIFAGTSLVTTEPAATTEFSERPESSGQLASANCRSASVALAAGSSSGMRSAGPVLSLPDVTTEATTAPANPATTVVPVTASCRALDSTRKK